MKKLFGSLLVCLAIITGYSTVSFSYGGGGGDGGGDGMEDLVGTTLPQPAEPPPGFLPIPLGPVEADTTYVTEEPFDTRSVAATEITILVDEPLTPEEIAAILQDPHVQWVAITAGGILIGYATAGMGLPVYGQALAGGAFSAATSYATSDGKVSSTIYGGIKDTAIGFIPVPPPAQAAISAGVDVIAEDIRRNVAYAPAFRKRSTRAGGYSHTYSR